MTNCQILSLSFKQINSIIKTYTNTSKLKLTYIIQPHFASKPTNTYHLTIRTTSKKFPELKKLVESNPTKLETHIINDTLNYFCF